MIRRPPRSTRTDTLFPYTTLFRSNKKVRLVLTYPPSTGRNFAEIIRAIDSLQLTDAQSVATPVNWNPGEEVIVSPKLSDEEAKSRFRSEERREGKEGVRTCRVRGPPYTT